MKRLRELTPETLGDVLTRCSANRNYQACIVFKDNSSILQFVEEIRISDLCGSACRYFGASPVLVGDLNLHTGVPEFGILFDQNSFLEFYTAGHFNDRGCRFNEILYESGLESSYIFLKLCQVLADSEAAGGSPRMEEIEPEPFDKELLEYLDGFNVIKGGADGCAPRLAQSHKLNKT